ncbi:hypothetical protein ACWEPN_24575 [Nonomuraea wenchangensis]
MSSKNGDDRYVADLERHNHWLNKEHDRLLTQQHSLIATNAHLVSRLGIADQAAEGLRREVAGLRPTIEWLNAEVRRLAEVVERHESDIRDRLASHTRGRADTITDRHRHYAEISDRFNSFYQQDIRPFVRRLRPRLDACPDEPRRPEASLISRLLMAMFDGPAVDSDLFTALLAQVNVPADDSSASALLKTARQLRQDAEAGGLEHRWMFDHDPLQAGTEPREIFTGCDDHDPAAFVVRPAFLVENTPLSPPMIFTSRHPSPGPMVA